MNNIMHKTLAMVSSVVLLGGLSACSVYPGLSLEDGLNRSVMYDDENGEVAGGPHKTQLIKITTDVVMRQRSAEQNYLLAEGYQTLEQLAQETGTDEKYEYRIGVGDVLGVHVWGHPELSTRGSTGSGGDNVDGREVGPDGRIFYPFVGNVKVEGKTINQVRRALVSGLDRYIQNPQMDVKVLRFRSKRVYLTGNLDASGLSVPITAIPLRLLDALNLFGRDSGSSSQSVGGNQGLRGPIQSANATGRMVLTRDGVRYFVNLARYFEEGRLPPNVLLKDGDILYVLPNTNQRVYVMGEIEEQIALPVRLGDMTLAQALSESGGLSKLTSDASSIFVVRGLTRYDEVGNTYPSAVVYHLDGTTADAMVLADRFNLQPSDVVYVAPTGLTALNRVLAQIVPSLSFLRQAESTRLLYQD